MHLRMTAFGVRGPLSGVACVTMLALGFNLLLPLGGGLAVCVLIAVASAIVFFGLVDGE